jgi:hypothetical protein
MGPTTSLARSAKEGLHMKSIITKPRCVVLALACCLVAAPRVALAAPGGAQRPPAAATDGDDAYPDEPAAEPRAERRFPMEGKRFLELVEKRLQRVEQRIDAKLSKHKLPPDLEREIRAELGRAEAKVREAARKVAADGKVTEDEAWQVRELALELREQARAKLGPKVRAALRNKRGDGPGPKRG